MEFTCRESCDDEMGGLGRCEERLLLILPTEINFLQIALRNTLMLIQVICNMQDMLESVYMIIIIYSITCLDEINE